MFHFRRIIFWVHLILAIPAALLVANMCATGILLAFREEIIALSDAASARAPAPTPDARPLSVDELLEKTKAAGPEMRPLSLRFFNDPDKAVLAVVGRGKFFYINPYTGEIKQPGARATRAFMDGVAQWHRWLRFDGENRAIGKQITGAASIAFLLLIVTGLVVWFPRHLHWRRFRLGLFFNHNLHGRTREWNWHNVFGFWFSPLLVVLILTALPISYRWANDLIFTLSGEPVPQMGPPGMSPPKDGFPKFATSGSLLSKDALLKETRRQFPNWENITLFPFGPRPQGRPTGATGARPVGATRPVAVPRPPVPAASDVPSPASSSSRASRPNRRERGGRPDHPTRQETPAPALAAVSPVMLQIQEKGRFPQFSNVQAHLNPYTGEVLRKETFADYSTGRKIRTWARFLHTGEAFGPVGKAVALLASLAGLFLVYTGIALLYRRLRAKLRKHST
ncbi:MAG: PepSY domain-containing protein [Puniceicoccales bacterium]|jgi:uncharacterized iron-regulated membrane protein|nr:PepSY domain-containing protein [Puniceicoccales bacterium]